MAVTKIGAGIFWTHNLNTDAQWTEAYSGFGGSNPYVHLSYMTSPSTPGFVASHARFGQGWAVFSSNGNVVDAYMATRNRDAQATPDRDRIANSNAAQFILDEATAATEGAFDVESPAADGWKLDRRTGNTFPQSTSYAAMTIMGSLEAFIEQNYYTDSVGSTHAVSVGFQPDVVIFRSFATSSGGFFFNGHVVGIGMADLSSSSLLKQYAFGQQYENGSPDVQPQVVASGFIFTQPTTAEMSSASNFRNLIISSVDANGYHLVVDSSAAGSAGASLLYQSMALKFNEAGSKWRLDYVPVNGTVDNGTFHYQCNSLLPHFIHALATLNDSLNYVQNRGVLSVGFASSDDAVEVHATMSEEVATTTDNMSFVNTNGLVNPLGWASGTSQQRYTINSVTMSANSITYTEGRTPTNHVGAGMIWFMFGETTNAATHLQDENGSSVFLHTQEFGDDLLLVPDTAPAGSPVKRDFPVDDQRDYPTIVNTIRNWPIV